jgi:hypothetical protein
LVSRNRIFLKFELEKFWFLRIEFFIKGKIEFLEGEKNIWEPKENSSLKNHIL